MRRSRFYLLRRRLSWTRRFRVEFGWGWAHCWDTAGRNQRWALEQVAIERGEAIERAEFEASVLEGIDHLDVLVLDGAI